MTRSGVDSVVEALRHWSRERPTRRAYVFLANDGTEFASLTFEQLDRESRSIAAELQRCAEAGERALLLYPPGPGFITAFFGCLYAGIVAIPVRPPHPARPTRTLSRLPGIVENAGPGIVLGTEAMIDLKATLSHEMPGLAECFWLATDRPGLRMADDWRGFSPDPETMALLQYTSGSTDSPKGVMVSHGNLLGNLTAIYECEENDADSVSVTWLPPYHDMGLVEGMLQPLFGGYTCYQMPPVGFLRRPLTWLESISRYRATNSGAPNFAYDLCVDKTTPEQRRQLDLSRWRVAYNGAEPVRPRTLERFHRAFEGCGFRWNAFYPVYGLAEATLVVSSGRQSSTPVFLNVDAETLGRDRVIAARQSGRVSVTLVSCGAPAPGTEVAIVHPRTRRRCGPGEVGEIWVAGPGVTRGYWRKPQQTERIFGARLADSRKGPFLRTGDLGLLRDGELYVTGRLKDVIIIRGRKHYAQDIESTVEHCHPAIRASGCASFAIYTTEAERLAVVAELERRPRNKGSAADRFDRGRAVSQNGSVIDAIRQAVAERHEIDVHMVALLPPGAIPRTTSGKLRRRRCRELFLREAIKPIETRVWRTAPPTQAPRLRRTV